MTAAYKRKNEPAFIGFHAETAPDGGYQKCPEFRERESIELCSRLIAQAGMPGEKMKPYAEKLFPARTRRKQQTP